MLKSTKLLITTPGTILGVLSWSTGVFLALGVAFFLLVALEHRIDENKGTNDEVNIFSSLRRDIYVSLHTKEWERIRMDRIENFGIVQKFDLPFNEGTLQNRRFCTSDDMGSIHMSTHCDMIRRTDRKTRERYGCLNRWHDFSSWCFLYFLSGDLVRNGNLRNVIEKIILPKCDDTAIEFHFHTRLKCQKVFERRKIRIVFLVSDANRNISSEWAYDLN